MGGWGKAYARRIGDALLGASVDDHARVLLVYHGWHERLLNVEHTGKALAGGTNDSLRTDAPKHIDVENLVPDIKTLPGRSPRADASVVHQNTDLSIVRSQQRRRVRGS